jgi:uncharacterized protein YuzE
MSDPNAGAESEFVRYYPDTDTLYVEIRPWPHPAGGQDTSAVGGEDAGEDLVIHYGPDDRPYAYEIEHASRHPEHIAAALAALRAARGFAKAA